MKGGTFRGAQDGMSIIEVLVAITVSVIVLSAVSSTLLATIKTDGQSRARTSINTVVESWFDRYRANQEPFGPIGSVCTGSSSAFTCTYAAGSTYASDGVYTHSVSATNMSARFGTYRNVITGTLLNQGTNRQLWQVSVQVTDATKNLTLGATTYVLR
ncbi:prepilin-type N-terminal cleavage/methylation domain-containing protein [Deinococcus sp. KSM4-11]|uniref:type IV pilus modification PilV family protein n=1 Tax=Deinococcus sp. KSM4-11 TaxID=2568654 RepID=UPI0010A422EF|nr:prepilin-type N-terminal cleavage/methylation domain-containing protein [Deinococcus sp. KSM4-11]THF86467.1 prepilin-type N-terminal cleavage/methylation domain-containing protein [Deinococcus sp. KSM4-11]